MMISGGVIHQVWPKLSQNHTPGKAWVILYLVWAPVACTIVCYVIARANRRAADRIAEERHWLAQSQLQASDDSADRS